MDSCNQKYADTQGDVLLSLAVPRKKAKTPYAGELTVSEVWNHLQEHDSGEVVDVRTESEWKTVGVPDLSSVNKSLHFLTWENDPNDTSLADYAQKLEAMVPDKETPLFFLCRLGVRSFNAANVAAGYGYKYAFNIIHGFEGDVNIKLQRGQVNGWQGEGLPWVLG